MVKSDPKLIILLFFTTKSPIPWYTRYQMPYDDRIPEEKIHRVYDPINNNMSVAV